MLLSDTVEQENQPCSNLLWGMKKTVPALSD